MRGQSHSSVLVAGVTEISGAKVASSPGPFHPKRGLVLTVCACPKYYTYMYLVHMRKIVSFPTPAQLSIASHAQFISRVHKNGRLE